MQNLQWLLARVGLQKSAHVLNVKSPRRPDWHATFSGSAAAAASGRRADSKAARRRREAGGFGRCLPSSRIASAMLAENLGDFPPREVVALRRDGVSAAKYQAALDGGHDVILLISEVWGCFPPEAMRFLGELAQARNDGIDIGHGSSTDRHRT